MPILGFRESLPVTLTSFVNKCGNIGLSLLPMLLIDRQLTIQDAATVMGTVKSAQLFGILLSGWLSDRMGARFVVLMSFSLSALGLTALTCVQGLFLLTLCAALAQLGTSMYTAPARLLIMSSIPDHLQRVGLGWLRTANNCGMILSYSIAALASSFGLVSLFIFDAITSLLAVITGARILPREQIKRIVQTPPLNSLDHTEHSFLNYGILTTGIALYSFIYEFFMTGAAAQFRFMFGADGLKVFSTVMVINTVICTALAVIAAQYFANPRRVLAFGFALTALGQIMMFEWTSTRLAIFLAAGIVSLGEVVFTSLSQYALLRATPPGKNQGTTYSVSNLMSALGRILGATIAIPAVAQWHTAGHITTVAAVLGILSLAWYFKRTFSRVEISPTEPKAVAA